MVRGEKSGALVRLMHRMPTLWPLSCTRVRSPGLPLVGWDLHRPGKKTGILLFAGVAQWIERQDATDVATIFLKVGGSRPLPGVISTSSLPIEVFLIVSPLLSQEYLVFGDTGI